MNIALFCQKKDAESISYIEACIESLLEKNTTVFVLNDLYKNASLSQKHEDNILTFSDYTDLKNAKIDFLFSFGGDGTILSALTVIQDLEIPIVGVNLGRLGFLANFNKEDFLKNIDHILYSQPSNISQRSVLEVSCNGKNIDFPYALNDISVTRKETTSMIGIETLINNQLLSVFWADGLIIATPTGSTAYSLSCNGPIIEPSSDSFVITPIAPHNLSVRPIIIKDSSTIQLKVKSRTNLYTLSLDSRLINMEINDEITIRKAPFKVNLVQPPKNNFFNTLHKKLFWGEDKRN